jgi:hypothetical protein
MEGDDFRGHSISVPHFEVADDPARSGGSMMRYVTFSPDAGSVVDVDNPTSVAAGFTDRRLMDLARETLTQI